MGLRYNSESFVMVIRLGFSLLGMFVHPVVGLLWLCVHEIQRRVIYFLQQSPEDIGVIVNMNWPTIPQLHTSIILVYLYNNFYEVISYQNLTFHKKVLHFENILQAIRPSMSAFRPSFPRLTVVQGLFSPLYALGINDWRRMIYFIHKSHEEIGVLWNMNCSVNIPTVMVSNCAQVSGLNSFMAHVSYVHGG